MSDEAELLAKILELEAQNNDLLTKANKIATAIYQDINKIWTVILLMIIIAVVLGGCSVLLGFGSFIR